MARGCTGLRLSAACRQIRFLRCEDGVIRLFTLGPVLESCTRMLFAPWDAAYPGLERVHLVAFTPREQKALARAAARRFENDEEEAPPTTSAA